MAGECQTESLTPMWVTVVFGAFSFIMLMFTIIISMKHLKTSTDWSQASLCKKLKLCARGIWRRKSVYLPMISHLSDTVSDIASVVEFKIVADSSDPTECGVNVQYLFILSIGSMVLYRVVPAFKIYQITSGSLKRVLLQLLDLELYHILYFSHKWNISGSSSPQRMLSVLEAALEAAPQCVIQLTYLLFTANPSSVVLISTIFSFLNLTFSIISDDAKGIGLKLPADLCEFILLYLFRILDIPSKLLIYTFLWYFVSGYVCSAVLLLDAMIAIGLYLSTKYTDALLVIVSVPLTFGHEDYENWVKRYWHWSILQTIGINIFIWFFRSNSLFEKDTFVVSLWFYCSIASILKWYPVYRLVAIDEWLLEYTKERANLDSLLQNQSYTDAIELILFQDADLSTATTKVYGGDTANNRYTLLAIAALSDNKQLFGAILQHGLDKKVLRHQGRQERYLTALMATLQANSHDEIQRILKSPQIDFDYLMISDGYTASYYVVQFGTLETFGCFVDCMDRLSETENDAEAKRAKVLNKAVPDQNLTVFHVAEMNNNSAEWYPRLYNAYRSEANAKEALSWRAKYDGKTVLDSLIENEKYTKEQEEFISNKLGIAPREPTARAVELASFQPNAHVVETSTINNSNSLPLAEGWRIAYTQNGKMYYQNDATQQTSWIKPNAHVDVQSSTTNNSNILPSGWRIAYAQNGKMYYQNDATKQTSWIKPIV